MCPGPSGPEVGYPSALQDEVYDAQKALPENKALWQVVSMLGLQTRRLYFEEIREESLTEAKMMSPVSSRLSLFFQYHPTTPPMVRASVNDGTLYMPVVCALVFQSVRLGLCISVWDKWETYRLPRQYRPE
jgi:hypothetical protein